MSSSCSCVPTICHRSQPNTLCNLLSTCPGIGSSQSLPHTTWPGSGATCSTNKEVLGPGNISHVHTRWTYGGVDFCTAVGQLLNLRTLPDVDLSVAPLSVVVIGSTPTCDFLGMQVHHYQASPMLVHHATNAV